MGTKRLTISLLAIMATLAISSPGLAQNNQSSKREHKLEDMVQKLLDKVNGLEKRINQLESSKSSPSIGSASRTTNSPSLNSGKWSDASTLRPYWKDGLRLDSNDGSVKLKIGGRIQHDFAFFAEDSDVERNIGSDFEDGTEFRRSRIYFSGSFDNDTFFKAQYDFAGGDADFKDVYLGFKNVAYVGNVKAGQFKEPFSLEENTSSNYITFMERSLVNTFAPRRNTGVMAYNTMMDKRMTWAAGVFRQTDSFGDGMGGRDYNVTARMTWLPIYENDGEQLLHLGVGYTHQNYEENSFRIRARPESHMSPRIVDTGVFPAEYGDIFGTEAAYVDGPFSLQGEYVHAFYNSKSRFFGDPDFWAASLQASYFLTGEHRPYKKSSGTFDRVRPLENYSKDGGKGAWELAARFSYLSLNDHRIHGGRLRDLTLGVNWYWNPNLRMMWNYVFADPSDGGRIDIFQWRIQMAF